MSKLKVNGYNYALTLYSILVIRSRYSLVITRRERLMYVLYNLHIQISSYLIDTDKLPSLRYTGVMAAHLQMGLIEQIAIV